MALATDKKTNKAINKEVLNTSADQSAEQVGLDAVNQILNEDEVSKDQMIVVFAVGKEEYALPIDLISEVVKTPPIATVPQVPQYIKGVANIRGNVFAILDLNQKISQDLIDESTEHRYSLVLQHDEFKVAVAVEQVPDTLMIHDGELDTSPNVVGQASLNETSIKGVVKKDDRMIILIDANEMIENENFASC